MRRWLVGILAAVSVPLGAQGSMDPRVRAIDSVMTAAERAGFSGIVLVRQRDVLLLDKAYGSADRERGRRMTTSTGIEIGSLVKPITVVALLRLQEMGKLSLNDSLGRFFPQTPADKRGITLELIARHRAGFRDTFGGDYDTVSREWIVRQVLAAPLLHAPGTKYQYSNSGFSLLAAVIEQTAGTSYESFVREQVLRPARTLRIGYRLAGWTTNDLAVGYRSDGVRWGTPLDSAWLADGPGWNLRGNGGMFATTRELSQWYEALTEGKVLGPDALKQFYAISATQSASLGGRILGHAGGNGIFNTLQITWTDADTHFTIFSSVADHRAERLWPSLREHVIAIAGGTAPEAR